MEEKSSFFKTKASLFTLLIVLIIYLIGIPLHKYERLTCDSVVFLSIAQKYIRGDFVNAIKGYWGPLTSWLLVPLLSLGSTSLFAINVIHLITGILTLIGIRLLSYKFETTEMIRSLILLASLPIVLQASLHQPQDFLLLCTLVYYLGFVFKKDYHNKVSNSLTAGVLGALAYFSKAYAFPFFISHFLLINIAHYLRVETKFDKKRVLRNALVGFTLFALISSVWIGILSNKYNHITFGTTGMFNLVTFGPGLPGTGIEKGQPIFYKGFIKPFNNTAINAWEDPDYIEVESWEKYDLKSNIKYLIKHALNNIYRGVEIFEYFSPLSIAIIIAYLLLLFNQHFKGLFLKSEILYPLFTVILYSAGYMLFHYEERYLWIINILLLVMGGHLLRVLFQTEFFKSNLRKSILAAFLIISFLISPSKYLISMYIHQEDNSGLYSGRQIYNLSKELKNYNIYGNIASNKEYATNNSWYNTLRLAHYLNTPYYGQAKAAMTDDELKSELKKYDIDYYFFWGESKYTPQFLSNYSEVTRGEIPNLKVYSLKEKRKI